MMKTLSSALLAVGLLAAPSFADTPGMTKAEPSAPLPTAKLDADMAKVLEVMAKLDPKPLETLTAEEARKQPTPTDAVKNYLSLKNAGKKPAPEAVGKVENMTYTDALGGTAIPLRVYTPKTKVKGALPVIVYFHGGGWVIADLDVYDAAPRALANATGAIVVSAHYRQAPENKFPAAHDDAFAAYKWVIANASKLNVDITKIAIAGESAGANLAINTAIRARDEKIVTPLHMLLVYPVAGVDMTTPSYVANATAKPLGKAQMEWFVKQTFASKDAVKDKRIDLVSRTDLKGLPSATVITAEIDPLRSEGQQLAKVLAAAGVTVDAADYTGVTHEFFGMAPAVAKAKQAQQRAATNIKAAFKAAPTVSAK